MREIHCKDSVHVTVYKPQICRAVWRQNSFFLGNFNWWEEGHPHYGE